MGKLKMKLGRNREQNEHVESDTAAEMPPVQIEEAVSEPGPVTGAPTLSALTQREAVYEAVMKVLQEDQVQFEVGNSVKPLLTEAAFKRICASLVAGFQAGRIALKHTEGNQRKLAEVKLLEIYVIGLVNNWLRRDKRLNGKNAAKAEVPAN